VYRERGRFAAQRTPDERAGEIQAESLAVRGPVAVVERDEFGMREDFHLIDRWRYLGTAHNDAGLRDLLENPAAAPFDPDIYRLINKFIQAGKVRIEPLGALL